MQKWLATPPYATYLRIDTSKISRKKFIDFVEYKLSPGQKTHLSLNLHEVLEDVIEIMDNDQRKYDLKMHPFRFILTSFSLGDSSITCLDEDSQGLPVIVGSQCGASVLRGAEVFAPGVMACPSHLRSGDKINLFCDVENVTLKGTILTKDNFDAKNYVFIGQGVANLSRSDLFKLSDQNGPPSGIAVTMSKCIYPCPRISDNMLQEKRGNFHF